MNTPRMTEKELAEHQRRVRISRSKTGWVPGNDKKVRRDVSDGPGFVSPAVMQGSRKISVASPTFTVYGEAVGKPRMTQRDKWKQRPAVVRYRAWCDLVRYAAALQVPMRLTHGIRLSIVCYLPCPTSCSIVKRERMMGTPHLGKPDLDNLVKGVMDALFVNDAYVYVIEAKKYWDNGIGPHVVVRIEEEVT